MGPVRLWKPLSGNGQALSLDVCLCAMAWWFDLEFKNTTGKLSLRVKYRLLGAICGWPSQSRR
jgi:hypothetical protein